MDPDPGGPKTDPDPQHRFTQCCGSGSAWVPIDFDWLDPDSGEQDDPKQ
jgi:hypothetical protein